MRDRINREELLVSFAEAKILARETVDRKLAEGVEVRDDADRVVFRYPRTARPR